MPGQTGRDGAPRHNTPNSQSFLQRSDGFVRQMRRDDWLFSLQIRRTFASVQAITITSHRRVHAFLQSKQHHARKSVSRKNDEIHEQASKS